MARKKAFEQLDDATRELHESWDHVARSGVLVTMLGVVVWCVCTALREAVMASTHWVLDVGSEPTWRGALLLLGVLTIGATIRGLLMRREGWEDAAGEGMDLALRNYHITYEFEGDDPQPRYERPAFVLAARKFIATLLTLGSSASGGLTAPLVLVAEGVSAGFSRVFAVRSEYELRTYQLAGISAAVSTLLGAPFTAALFAIEIVYGDRIIYRKLAYCLWAGIVCYWLDNWLRGSYEPIFYSPSHAEAYSLQEFSAAAIVSIMVSVPVALGFGLISRNIQELVARLRPAWHAIITALAQGLIALAILHLAQIEPIHVLSTGHATLAVILEGTDWPWWVFLLILIGKAVTTNLTLVGRGSVGMLTPSMFLGGIAGALVATIATKFGFSLDPALFAVVGIASSLVAVVGVPLAAIALVFEVFGKAFGPPAIVACGLTYLISLRVQIYRNQRRSPSPGEDEKGTCDEPPPPESAVSPSDALLREEE